MNGHKASVVCQARDTPTSLSSGSLGGGYLYLSHHGLLVLLLLCDLDGRQLRDSRHQEVHQDVLTVGQLVHHVLQTCGYEFGVEIMVIPVRRRRRCSGVRRGRQASQLDDVSFRPAASAAGFRTLQRIYTRKHSTCVSILNDVQV